MVEFCQEKNGTLTVSLYVQPRASKTEITGIHDNSLKIRVKAPPVDGKANEEIIHFFSKVLGIAKSGISIKVGSVSKRKILEISGISKQIFLEKTKCQF